MPVQTIECHIATVLMKRFLDGDDLPEELLSDLEKHVQACPSCQATLNNEKASIEEVLDGPKKKGLMGAVAGLVGKKAEAKAPEKPIYAQAALVEASRKSLVKSVPQGSAAFKNPKVLMLSGGLAIVLVLMSTVLRDPTALLGKKAAAGLATTVETDKKPDPEAATKDPAKTDETKVDDTKTDEGTMAHSSTDPETHDPAATEGDGSTASTDQTDSHGTGEVAKGDVTGHPLGAHPGPDGEMASVPGKKTIDEGSVILIGGHDEPAKTTEPAKKAPAKRTPTKKTSTRPKSTTKKSSGGSGIKVYDPSGRVIK